MAASKGDATSPGMWQCPKKMTPAVARHILTWRFSLRDINHLGVLLEKNREGTISPAEHREVERLVMLGEVLDVLHLEAELALRRLKRRL